MQTVQKYIDLNKKYVYNCQCVALRYSKNAGFLILYLNLDWRKNYEFFEFQYCIFAVDSI